MNSPVFPVTATAHAARDRVHVARDGAEVYGARIGILHVPCRIPFPPGSVGNLSTYRYPVLLRPVLAAGDPAEPQAELEVVEAALYLERQGVAAITSDCGTLMAHQRTVARAVSVPVILSPLLQLPLALATVGPQRKVGVIAAVGANVGETTLALAGVDDPARVVVAGMEAQPAFRAGVLDESGMLDGAAVEREAVEVAVALLDSNPDVRALVFDCADLPPYRAAVCAATGLPVFDFVTMIDLLESATRAA